MKSKLNIYLKGKSREEFAAKIGTTFNYVNLLAAGARRPSPELALKIEKATGGKVTRDEVLFPELYSHLSELESQIIPEFDKKLSRRIDNANIIIEG
jgi:DNA-binding transcriptional regulator YdaS (Cro superfamily)